MSKKYSNIQCSSVISTNTGSIGEYINDNNIFFELNFNNHSDLGNENANGYDVTVGDAITWSDIQTDVNGLTTYGNIKGTKGDPDNEIDRTVTSDTNIQNSFKATPSTTVGISFSIWVKLFAGHTANQTMMMFHTGSTDRFRMYYNTNRWAILLDKGSNYLGISYPNPGSYTTTNEWTHIAFTINSTGNKIYINGVDETDGSSTSYDIGTSSTVYNPITTDYTTFSAMYYQPGNNEHFEGYISHMIWSSSIWTVDQVKLLYNMYADSVVKFDTTTDTRFLINNNIKLSINQPTVLLGPSIDPTDSEIQPVWKYGGASYYSFHKTGFNNAGDDTYTWTIHINTDSPTDHRIGYFEIICVGNESTSTADFGLRRYSGSLRKIMNTSSTWTVLNLENLSVGSAPDIVVNSTDSFFNVAEIIFSYTTPSASDYIMSIDLKICDFFTITGDIEKVVS